MAEMVDSRILRMIPLLALVCLVSIPAEAQYSGGSGTPEDPYQIATAEDLIALGEEPNDYDKHFILTADIDLDPNLPGRKVFDKAVIAPDTDDTEYWFRGTRFEGVFDGNGHTISHLTIVGETYLGLFGELEDGAEVFNLGLEVIDVNGVGHCVGGLAGFNGGSITNCYSTGSIIGTASVGGLVGFSNWHSSITNCYSTATVNGTGYSTGGLVGRNGPGSITTSYSTGAVFGVGMVGGLVGRNDSGTITRCYSAGNVAGEWYVGGLVGCNAMDWAPSKIIDCYSLGSVTGTDTVGGLVGSNQGICMIAVSYSAGYVVGNENVGGLVGANEFCGVVQDNCFWDIETSGQTTSDGGTGKTTAQMQMASTFVGWGRGLVWMVDEGVDYPSLVWENLPGEIIVNRYGGGSGTEEDPYLIYTAEQLNMIGLGLCDCDKHYKLMADIDLSVYDGTSFNIIGRDDIYSFVGVFDGQGHTISNFTYASTGTRHIGLFGYVGGYGEGEDGTIKNLGLLNPRIDAGTRPYVGSLVGYNAKGTITNCYVAGGSIVGGDYIGGLVGGSSGPITNCASSASVVGDDQVGCLVGRNYGWIGTSYSTGAVSGAKRVGGLVGDNYGSITVSYSTGMVTGNDCVGGLVGLNRGDITSSFWGIQTSGRTNMCGIQEEGAAGCDGSFGLTTDEMQTASTFLDAGWDFIDETENGTDDIWWISEGQDYPRLWWELINADVMNPPENRLRPSLHAKRRIDTLTVSLTLPNTHTSLRDYHVLDTKPDY